MNEYILILVPIIVILVCFLIRVPIPFALLGAAVTYILMTGTSLSAVCDTVMGQLYSNSTLIAAPLFIFTANVMMSSKISEYMYTFIKAIFGGKKGTTAYMNIFASLIFSGMSGSAVADVAGNGVMEIEEMKRDGYDMPFSCAVTAATAVIGPIFPPSIQMVIFAMLTGASVGSLFLGGVVPALMLVIMFAVYVWYISRKRDYPRGPKYTMKEFLKFTWKALPALGTPIILLGGIYTGVVTTTESGVLAAFYGILISIFVYKVLGPKELIKAIKNTVIQSGIITASLASSFALSYVTARSGMGVALANAVEGITTNPLVFMFLVNIVFIIAGMFVPTEISTFIITPLLIPIVNALGINMIYFGVVTSINIILGNVTPPFGFLCFTISGMTGVNLGKIFKEMMPMIIGMFIVLILLILFPNLILFIPSMMG
ncbi:MAG: TRAP transporter large permease [Blautia sp.]|nr:TRAP transporter large permease [Blautia sp.]